MRRGIPIVRHRSMKSSLSEESTGSCRTQFEKIIHTYGVDTCFNTGDQSITNMEESIEVVEAILKYKFKDKILLEEALTRSSFTDAPTYQCLCSRTRSLVFSSWRIPILTPVDSLISVPPMLTLKDLIGLWFATGFISSKYIRHNNAIVLNDKVLFLQLDMWLLIRTQTRVEWYQDLRIWIGHECRRLPSQSRRS
ncbi:hypothetical protein L1987_19817 [Smallanthus sonchifolius]|uniref:Uncharacterized protein n=1 Tax=Smallanthus sonchifolius TaxID=185202 RepID=A0ACB9IT15_9ASTR|nr:hypothetical protein L1987_19817 [Smallanthus sonchifolius]